MSFWDYFQAYGVYMLLYCIYQHKYQYIQNGRHCSSTIVGDALGRF